ncbi:MAG: hypothetical protein H6661_07965 [Ardenticatenaceae bacterium]|nr:hypothetical protein [Ardenticatenaceae bacterium]
MNGPISDGTIGLENADGSDGVQYAFDNIAVTNGSAVCFDMVGAGNEPTVITYQVTVDANTLGPVTNDARSYTSNPGGKMDHSKATVVVGMPTYMPIILKP